MKLGEDAVEILNKQGKNCDFTTRFTLKIAKLEQDSDSIL